MSKNYILSIPNTVTCIKHIFDELILTSIFYTNVSVLVNNLITKAII